MCIRDRLKSGTVDGVNLAEELKALKQQNAEREANDAVVLALKAGKSTPDVYKRQPSACSSPARPGTAA